ncbi:uncharacterized protein JCM10292_004783 [Rhodotorula paludigena]|uniref:uncharacterized protein n=1 Tax=Rhodotorula paludigena TaxID=86838 RepID=UPI00317465CC
MSSASGAPVLAPRHARKHDHALVLPPSDALTDQDAANKASNAPSAYAAVSRALAGMLAFMFKRPVRLFRPVKISTWAGIQAIAEEQGRSVTPGFVRGLLRKEGWRFFPKHVLPPLLINATIGLTLFTSYTTSEAVLSRPAATPFYDFLVVPFISGSLAGAAQSLLSAPLDNARLLLLRRQRFLRLAQSQPRNARRSRSHKGSTSTVTGTPFVSWWSLIRDSVFQSARTAGVGGDASATTRERIEQGRRWARRGWSLFGLSLVKDSVGFGTFFVLFEVGRELSRIAGLRWDGIDPDREAAETKERRTASGLVLQSFGILISGGLAGWIFSLVARPFERMRGAVWEGRSKWAERDGRLKVIEELELRGHDPLAHAPAKPATPRRRRTSAGGASERRARAALGAGGRKGFTVRLGRIRSVSRSAARTKRRRARQKLRDRLARADELAQLLTTGAAEAGPARKAESPQARQPMPGAPALVRAACARYGAATFLFAPRSVLQAMDAAKPPQAKSASPLVKPLPARGARPVGPTRLSARGRKAVEQVAQQASGRGWRAGARVLSYIPPYAIGFFMYALTSGDLKIEV